MKTLSETLTESLIAEASKPKSIKKLTVAQVKDIVDAAADFADYDNNSRAKGSEVTYDDYDNNTIKLVVYGSEISVDGKKMSFDEFLNLLTGSDDFMKADVLKDAGIKQ